MVYASMHSSASSMSSCTSSSKPDMTYFITDFQPVQNVNVEKFRYMEDMKEFCINYTSTIWPGQMNILCQDNFKTFFEKVAPFSKDFQNMDDYKKLKSVVGQENWDFEMLQSDDDDDVSVERNRTELQGESQTENDEATKKALAAKLNKQKHIKQLKKGEEKNKEVAYNALYNY